MTLSRAPLHQSGHSNRKSAKRLGVHRETIAKYIAAAETIPAKPDQRPGPTSSCERFRELIVSKLEQGLSGQRIYQDRGTRKKSLRAVTSASVALWPVCGTGANCRYVD